LREKLERGSALAGLRVIAMSEHVDYWNHLGWRDPFSSEQMTLRQQRYADRFQSQGPYTPQMVVDGAEEFVGSDASRARRAITLAADRPKLTLTLEPFAPNMFHINAPPSPSRAEVLLAIVYDPPPSSVAKGENSGRKLTHISVVQSLKRIGETSRGNSFDTRVPFDVRIPPVDPAPAKARAIVFVQERGQGRVLGAAEINLYEISSRQSAGIVAR
jgi:hypothetical protein